MKKRNKMKICICLITTLLMISSFSMMQVGADNKTHFDTQVGQPIQSAPFPGNNTGCTNTSVRLYITINDPAGDEMNITWSSNSSGSWEAFGWNSSINNGTFSQNGTNFTAFNTTYYTNISIDNGTTGWSNVTYNFTTMANGTIYITSPTNASTGVSIIPTIHINANDSCGNNLDVYWYENSTGTWTLVQTNSTVTANASVYYTYDNATNYSALYGWLVAVNNSYNNISNVFEFTTEDFPLAYEYPANQSTGNVRPPTNISVHINGTLINITYNYYNMTPWPHVFSQLYQWTNRNTARYEVLTLGAAGNWSNSFIWGNTQYILSINVSNGTIWANTSFWYNTTGSRYDVTNSGDVISGDVSITWTQREGVLPYDGIYDVDQTGDVVSNDLSQIWLNRT